MPTDERDVAIEPVQVRPGRFRWKCQRCPSHGAATTFKEAFDGGHEHRRTHPEIFREGLELVHLEVEAAEAFFRRYLSNHQRAANIFAALGVERRGELIACASMRVPAEIDGRVDPGSLQLVDVALMGSSPEETAACWELILNGAKVTGQVLKLPRLSFPSVRPGDRQV